MHIWVWICGCISLFALAASFFVEYGLGVGSCTLCKLQRACYVVSLLCSLLALKKQIPLARWALLTCLATGFCVSVYHCAVQYGFADDRCRSSSRYDSLTSYEEALFDTPSCSEVTWKLFGYPISVLNGALFLSLLSMGFLVHQSEDSLELTP